MLDGFFYCKECKGYSLTPCNCLKRRQKYGFNKGDY